MSLKINSGHGLSVRGNLRLVLSFVLVVAGVVSPSLALAAVPPATTQVSKRCELRVGGYAIDQYDSGEQPDEQATACNLSIPNGTAEGHASAGFGPGVPQVGIATVGAQISTYNGIAEANFSANVHYYFRIEPIAVAPNPPPALLPVLFSARGEGNSWRSGYGLSRSVGVVHLYGDPLDFDDARFEFEAYVVDETAYDPVDEEYQGGGFDETRSLDLYPNYTYGVTMSASCSLWAGPVGQNADASIDCSAEVDPFISFDQARFDAIMGANTFPLNQYYGFVFSENVPLPPPASAVLTLAKSGSGTGTITSEPAGISCGSDCTESYDTGTVVTLTAAPDAESTFSGWSGGGCSGTGTCEVTMDAGMTVTATFMLINSPPELSPAEGTVGTEITITGSGFGNKKGKVFIGGAATRIINWSPNSITAEITKLLSPGTAYEVVLQPKEPKGVAPVRIPGAFAMMAPGITFLEPVSGATPDEIVVSGNYFGTKKGKVYLEDTVSGKKKNCKVTSWGMDRIVFVVPKTSMSFPANEYLLKVTNKVGTDSTVFTVE